MRTFRRAIAERKISTNELVSPRQWEDEENVELPHLHRTRSCEPESRYDEAMHDDQLMRPLLQCDAVGPFFETAPMKYFGGTPIAYFAVFGMKDLLKELVGDPEKIELARQKEENEANLLTPAQKERVEQARKKAATWMETTLDGMPMPAPMPGPLSDAEREDLGGATGSDRKRRWREFYVAEGNDASERQDPRVLRHQVRAACRWRLGRRGLERLRGLRVLVAHGREDVVVRPSSARHLYRALAEDPPGCCAAAAAPRGDKHLLVLADAAHMVTSSHAPRLAATLRAFWAGTY